MRKYGENRPGIRHAGQAACAATRPEVVFAGSTVSDERENAMREVYGCTTIDQENWKRKRHFELFKNHSFPYVGLTAAIRVERLLDSCRTAKMKFFHTLLHFTMRTVNSIENFRYRILNGEIILFDSLDPGYTVLGEDELFYFAVPTMAPDLFTFHNASIRAGEKALREKCLDNPRLDVLYASSAPRVSFTEVMQPLGLSPDDSIPRIAFGKHHPSDKGTLLPLSIVGHHGLFDGFHIGRLVNELEEAVNDSKELDSVIAASSQG